MLLRASIQISAFSRTEDGRREILKEVEKYESLSENLRVEFSKILQEVGDQLEDGVLTLDGSLTSIKNSYSDLREREKKIYEDAVYDIIMKFGKGKNESRKRSRVIERSASIDDVNRACYKLVDALQEWSTRHGGLQGGLVKPGSQITVYSYSDKNDTYIIGVAIDMARYGDQPLFIDKNHHVLTKDDLPFNDILRLCATYTPMVEKDQLKVK